MTATPCADTFGYRINREQAQEVLELFAGQELAEMSRQTRSRAVRRAMRRHWSFDPTEEPERCSRDVMCGFEPGHLAHIKETRATLFGTDHERALWAAEDEARGRRETLFRLLRELSDAASRMMVLLGRAIEGAEGTRVRNEDDVMNAEVDALLVSLESALESQYRVTGQHEPDEETMTAIRDRLAAWKEKEALRQ